MAKKTKSTAAKPARVKPFDAKAYLKSLLASDGVESSDFALATDQFASLSQVEETIPTGSIAIDRLTNGGWPVGRIVEVAAKEGIGKSTLLDQSIAECQRMGGIACLLDTEQSRDFRHMRALGVDMDSLIVVRAETLEDGFARIDQLVDRQSEIADLAAKSGGKPPVMLVVWDSIGATPSKGELAGGADEKHVMEAARAIKMNMRRLTQRVARLRICLVLANHVYKDNMSGMGKYAPMISYGGSGILYHTSLRLFLRKKMPIKVGGVPVGHEIEAVLKKTRVNKPRPPAIAGLVYGCGVYNAWTLYEWGKANTAPSGKPWIVQRGAWSTLQLPDGTEEKFQNAFVGLGEILQAQPAAYTALIAHYFAEEVTDDEAAQNRRTSDDEAENEAEGEVSESGAKAATGDAFAAAFAAGDPS